MAKNKKVKAASVGNGLDAVADYRFPEATRKNNPPAKIAAEGYVPLLPKAEYMYSPRRPPELRFDPTGRTDQLPELLAEALRVHEPWLEWAGKREAKSFAVDPVALHIHERVSAQAILRVAARQDVMRSLFADPEQEYNEAVQFYKHDVDWSNRLILGDSLQVISSLARREDLAGKVQMIYIDPPYGIKFASNFQPEIGKRDVKDKEADLTREPEMVKAYRDTWTLGVHSYLAYLRDRLHSAKELLADTGSIFVQIGDENVHRVRCLLDEVFGNEAFCALIAFATTSSLTAELLGGVNDFILWYAKDRTCVKYHQLYLVKDPGLAGAAKYNSLEYSNGSRRLLSVEEQQRPSRVPPDARLYSLNDLTSSHEYSLGRNRFDFDGRAFTPRQRYWTTSPQGMSS